MSAATAAKSRPAKAGRKGRGAAPEAPKTSPEQQAQPAPAQDANGGSPAGVPTAPAKQEPRHPAPQAGRVQYREVLPNAAKTLNAIREMGYDSNAAIMDLVDNSIDAKASKIAVQIKAVGNDIVIDVLDNGVGMDEPTLEQALRLGSDTKHETTDLGKFGFGLVSASLSMARNIYVITRRNKAPAWEAVFDLAIVERENKFVIQLDPAQSERVLKSIGDQGTLVRLTQVDRINDTNVARFAANLRVKMGQVFRNFIKAGLKLSVNGRLVAYADPLMRDHPATRVVADTELKLGDKHASLTVVELPDLGTLGDAEAGIYPHNSGFYVVRNGRQLLGGETFGLYRHHHSYSHFRAELAFQGDLDTLFHVDIKKATVHPDDQLIAKLKDAAGDLIIASGKRGRERPQENPTTLKLEHAEEVVNSRLKQKGDAKQSVTTGGADKAEPAEKAEGQEGGESAGEGEATAESAPQEKRPSAKFGQFEGEPTDRFFRGTEKGGQWLIELNTRHPLVKLVADARHKQASAVLTYLTFSLAVAVRKAGRDGVGDKFVDAMSTALVDILGTGEEEPG